MARVRIRVAENFERNLENIEAFLIEQEAETAFAALLDAVSFRLAAALEEHPRMGRDWMLRSPEGARGKRLKTRITTMLGTGLELREFIRGDFLVLYALEGATAVLLAIRHHRQLAYDVRGGVS